MDNALGFTRNWPIAMKATFNISTPQAIAERPDGLNFKYIEYFAETKSKTATHKQLKDTKKQIINNKILAITSDKYGLMAYTA
jgi:hypothetical protein